MLEPGSKSQVSITYKIENNVSLLTDCGMLEPMEMRKFAWLF